MYLSDLQLKYFTRASDKNFLLFNCLIVASSIFGEDEDFNK